MATFIEELLDRDEALAVELMASVGALLRTVCRGRWPR